MLKDLSAETASELSYDCIQCKIRVFMVVAGVVKHLIFGFLKLV